MGVERPFVRPITVTTVIDNGGITDEAAWRQIASLHQSDSILDERSRSLITRQNRALSDYFVDRMIQRFQESIALDTVRNQYLMRASLYNLMSTESDRADLEKLNQTVYMLVFRTPSSDPWLGLLSRDVYTAIEDK
jgi:hypothetical protein